MEIKTMREFLSAVVEGTLTSEVKEFAEAQIAKIDATNEKRKEKALEKAKEKAPIFDAAFDCLSDAPILVSEVAAKMETSPQMASYYLRELVKQGRANVQDVKIPKVGTRKAYTRA